MKTLSKINVVDVATFTAGSDSTVYLNGIFTGQDSTEDMLFLS